MMPHLLINILSSEIGVNMNMFFKETGKNSKETIIFLHGGALAGWMWDEQLNAFKDYHCIVPDLPVHGHSSEMKSFTINNTAERIIEIIREHGHNGRAHVVGISIGGQIILQILSMNPEVVDHALISGTLIRKIPYNDELLKLIDHAIKVYEPVKDTEFFIKANMRTYNMPKRFFRKFKESTLHIKNDSLERVIKENMLFKLPDGLENMERPVLVLAGEKDYMIIKESARDLNHVLPQSKGYIVPKVGHVWNLEAPQLFNRILRRWIDDKGLNEDLLTIDY
jgi:pimeloyl-ACP methyl ester carboxylesterase